LGHSALGSGFGLLKDPAADAKPGAVWKGEWFEDGVGGGLDCESTVEDLKDESRESREETERSHGIPRRSYRSSTAYGFTTRAWKTSSLSGHLPRIQFLQTCRCDVRCLRSNSLFRFLEA